MKTKLYKSSKHKVLGIYTDWNRPNSTDEKPGAVGWYRIINPIAKLGGNIVGKFTLKPTAENAMELKEKGDIWFSKLVDNEGVHRLYGSHKEFTGAKLIIDLDDDPVTINRDHPEYEKLEAKKEMRVKVLKEADHVVCSTQEIADAVKEINPYTTVIPNSIDPAIWEVKKPKPRTDGKIRIGWMASGSHMTELPFILPVLREVCDKYPQVEVHFAGIVMDSIEGEQTYHHIGTSNYEQFPQWYADLDIDIAIAPLIDTQFNRCKSNIKWLEAGMLGIPCVCSPTVYEKSVENGKNGYIAKTRGQFVKYLSWLIENKELRERIGKAAKEEALKNWNVANFLPMYEELFDKIMDKKTITVVTAITGGKDTLKRQPDYPGVEYVAFVEGGLKDNQWKTLPACDKFKRDVMNAKIHKVLTHKYVDTPYIMWIDGNIELKKDPNELVKLMGKNDYAFFKHPGRDCVYDEADACVALGKGVITEIGEQIKTYAKAEHPPHAGLSELTVFMRKNNEHANLIFEKWWAEICRHSNRDQLSFPIIFKDEKWAVIPGSIDYHKDHKELVGNEFVKYSRHNHYDNQN